MSVERRVSRIDSIVEEIRSSKQESSVSLSIEEGGVKREEDSSSRKGFGNHRVDLDEDMAKRKGNG